MFVCIRRRQIIGAYVEMVRGWTTTADLLRLSTQDRNQLNNEPPSP